MAERLTKSTDSVCVIDLDHIPVARKPTVVADSGLKDYLYSVKRMDVYILADRAIVSSRTSYLAVLSHEDSIVEGEGRIMHRTISRVAMCSEYRNVLLQRLCSPHQMGHLQSL